jgi:methyl-accepting chemotaxis protein
MFKPLTIKTQPRLFAFVPAIRYNEIIETSKDIRMRMKRNLDDITSSQYEVEKVENIFDSSTVKSLKMLREIEHTHSMLKEAKELSIQMDNHIQNSLKAETALTDNLAKLSLEASHVQSILTMIGDIADQKNLLALNAAIETIRTNKYSRGFTIVVNEVRKLAERTQKSLLEINSTIQIILQSINDAGDKMIYETQSIRSTSIFSKLVEESITSSVKTMLMLRRIAQLTAEEAERCKSRFKSYSV